ncbi:primosomal replication protein PriC [Moellerella wisconsensis]|uniref:Primosomal replication protein N n=1 Tax=Moellerella wisconsensis ATCC 35017 TaxID=1354267 RepID=A0A0N0Z8E1_9GAMM|nr:primosomal replication protein [Moellerella wisconsensis]KPD03337.1 primosomal replication protein N'' [Moellerella wisconsensis ATCC 35017]VFS51164.1 Primosomal replication protein N'' [Moellerella wisconsensis]
MKISTLLAALKAQIDNLETQVAPLSEHIFSQARFDKNLFNRKSQKLGDCLAELNHYYAQLCHSVSLGHEQQVGFLTEKIVCQIQALAREVSTQSLRKKEDNYSQKKAQVDLYARLSQHQDFERRLVAMINDRELVLDKQTNHAARHKLQQELAALAGRLYRCRQALLRIDKSIEQQENLFRE